MIRTIVRKELTEFSRNGLLRWSAAIVFGLLAVSLLVGWRHYRDVRSQHEQAQDEMRRQWLNQGSKNPHQAAHYGIYAFKPKLPLSFVDTGLDAYTGVAVWLEAHRQDEFRFRPAQDSTAVERFGELTPARVLELFIPLLIVLLTFSSVAGEREQGTLRQLLSIGLDRAVLARGKAIGAVIALGALLVPAAFLGAIAVMLGSGFADLAASAGRIVAMTVAYAAYFGSFIALGLAASAWGRTARAALIVLLTFWIGGTLAAPRLVSELARQVYRSPSAFEFAQAVQRDIDFGLDGQTPRAARDAAFKSAVLREYGVASVEELPVNYVGLALNEGERYGNLVFDKHYGALWDTFRRQHLIHQLGSILSPYLAIRPISMGLAGTDFEQHQDFAIAAERYRRSLVTRMNNEVAARAGKAGRSYISGPEVWAAMPPFTYQAPDLLWVLRNQWLGATMLLVWLGGSWMLAIAMMRRADVA